MGRAQETGANGHRRLRTGLGRGAAGQRHRCRSRPFRASRVPRRIRAQHSCTAPARAPRAESEGVVMKYRVTCLTPTLGGDGQRLAPIDYMIWKDHVSVLDQRRIFRLLAKGPRLEGYLTQLKKAQKLDFASWGGFAQNFAGRRIPFEHPSSSASWERASGESL